ncbi:MAG: hypothetical protein DRH57_03050 [Candidatus Cloacimonadota bacterium]|nr:MAG: hypothetical protein DRH57_03050 [Candidatus Cloacimonadota bacterium]
MGAMMKTKFDWQKEKYRIIGIASLLVFACFLTYYFHVILGIGLLFTHLFYIPILLAFLWWKKKGLFVAIFLSALLIFCNFIFRDDRVVFYDYIRAAMFLVVAFVIGILSKQTVKAEKKMQKSEEKFRTLFEESKDAVYITTQQGKYVEVNQSMLNLFGYTIEEMKALNVQEIYAYSDDRQKFQQEIEKNGFVREYELKLRKKDGTKLDCLVTATVRKDDSGKIIGYHGIIRDITEQKQLQKRLQESERNYRILFENMLNGIIVIDAETMKILIANQTAVKMYGFDSVKDAIGQNSLDFIHPKHKERALNIIVKDMFENDLHQLNEFCTITRDGREIWINAIGKRIEYQGRLAGLISIREITDSKRAKDLIVAQRDLGLAIGRSVGLEETLRLCVDTAIRISGMDCGGIYLIDKDSGSIDIAFHKGLPNDFINSASHYDADSDTARLIMAGKPIYSRHHKLGVKLNETHTSENLRAIAIIPIHHEHKVIACLNIASHTLDQVPIFARNALETISSQIGSAIATAKAKKALKESEQRYRTLVETMDEGISIIDEKEYFTFANTATANIFGYSKEKIIGKNLSDFTTPEEFQRVLKQTAIRKTGKSSRYELTINRKDGVQRIIKVSASPIIDNGKYRGAFGIFIDITEQKRMEYELQKIQNLESIGILAGGIAHDFNNILTVIWGNISLSKLYIQSDKEAVKLLSIAEQACGQAKNLTQQLLSFSKGGMPIKKISSISELLKNTANCVLKGSNVRCKFSIPDDLWTTEIDKRQITQVINQLLINAVQAMPEGGIIKINAENIFVKSEHSLPLEQGKYVKITIKDTGIGIQKEYLQKIFDPYFTTKRVGTQKGTGLGLAICYSIIKNHNGYITVESELDVGTTFYIYLPASEKRAKIKKEVIEQPLKEESRRTV